MEETLGKRIVSNRKRLGITQDRLAEQLGVTAQAVSKWENDQSCPDITMLPRLAEVFGITTDELLGIAPKESTPEVVTIHEEDNEPEGFYIQSGDWDFHWDASRQGKLAFAIWVLLVGGLMLVSALLDRNWGMWDILWPTGLLAFGVNALIRRFTLLALACAFFGGIFLLGSLEVLPFSIGKELLLPLLLLFFGLNMLLKAFRTPQHNRFRLHRRGKHGSQQTCTLDGNTFDSAMNFGEDTHRIELPLLTQGNAEINFGELTLDLTGCGEFAPGCTVVATCNFGEMTILVPRSCRVSADKSASFGSVSFSGHPDPDAPYILELYAVVSFGEVEIRYV